MKASAHPDLTFPSLPDAEDLHARDTPVKYGGTSLRHRVGEDGAEIEWPEAGPSSRPMQPGAGERVGPFGAKLIAAMTGAVTTSLLMTPFDVLKTRLQTVQPNLPGFTPPIRLAAECCQTSLLSPVVPTSARRTGKAKIPPSTNPLACFTSPEDLPTSRTGQPRMAFSSLTVPAEAPRGCAFPSKWAGIWGEAVSIDQALRQGVQGGEAGFATLVLPDARAKAGNGFWQEVAAVRSELGFRGLWKGVGTTLTMSIPSAAIYMIGYENLLTRISPYFINSTDPNAHLSSIHRKPGTVAASGSSSLTAAPLIAGSLARTMAATVISPIEMFRTRLQALPSNGISPSYGSVFKDMGALVREKGVTMLWRGLGPTLWRDVPFSGIYWAGFEILKTNLSTHPNTSTLSPLTISFLSGALSGTVSALFTQPFDVLKTRRQVFTPSKDCSPAALKHRASTIPLALHVIKTEGWGALFAGTVPRCGKVAPACGLMIACYEGVGRALGAGNR